jgi:hypothetical protein
MVFRTAVTSSPTSQAMDMQRFHSKRSQSSPRTERELDEGRRGDGTHLIA